MVAPRANWTSQFDSSLDGRPVPRGAGLLLVSGVCSHRVLGLTSTWSYCLPCPPARSTSCVRTPGSRLPMGPWSAHTRGPGGHELDGVLPMVRAEVSRVRSHPDRSRPPDPQRRTTDHPQEAGAEHGCVRDGRGGSASRTSFDTSSASTVRGLDDVAHVLMDPSLADPMTGSIRLRCRNRLVECGPHREGRPASGAWSDRSRVRSDRTEWWQRCQPGGRSLSNGRRGAHGRSRRR